MSIFCEEAFANKKSLSISERAPASSYTSQATASSARSPLAARCKRSRLLYSNRLLQKRVWITNKSPLPAELKKSGRQLLTNCKRREFTTNSCLFCWSVRVIQKRPGLNTGRPLEQKKNLRCATCSRGGSFYELPPLLLLRLVDEKDTLHENENFGFRTRPFLFMHHDLLAIIF